MGANAQEEINELKAKRLSQTNVSVVEAMKDVEFALQYHEDDLAEVKKKAKVYTFDTMQDAQNASWLVAGDIVEALGYYTKGDGGGHKRTVAVSDDGSGVARGSLWLNYIVENGTVNVRHFGAKGDGVADDTTLIQKSLNYNKGKKVLDGTFILSDSILLNANTELFGVGKENTILKFITANKNGLIVENSNEVSIKNLQITGITGSGNNYAGIHVRGSSENVLVEDCKFYLCKGGAGIRFGYTSTNYTKNCRAINNDFYDCSMGIEIMQTINPIIFGNKIYKTSSHGIRMVGCKKPIIFGNNVNNAGTLGTTSYGIYLGGFGDGVSVTSFCEDVTINSNNILDCPNAGIGFVPSSKAINIISNTIDNTAVGIFSTNIDPLSEETVKDCLIQNNIIKNIPFCISLRGGIENLSIKNNEFLNFTSRAINLSTNISTVDYLKNLFIKNNLIATENTGTTGLRLTGDGVKTNIYFQFNEVLLKTSGTFVDDISNTVIKNFNSVESNTLLLT